MTKAQRRQHKADNAARREVGLVLARLPKPDSKTTARRRFEAAHDAWREAVGLGPFPRRRLAAVETAGAVEPERTALENSGGTPDPAAADSTKGRNE